MEILNNKAEYDVLGIGSALLDFTVQVNDADLDKLGLSKGGMQLIDEDQSREILSSLVGKSMEVTPGGSAANTLAGVANLSGKAVLLGAVGKDAHGDKYVKDTEQAGVKTKISRHDRMTGHAITFITPDMERTFATHLGAALQFNKDDVSELYIKKSKIIHLEGYLFEPPGLLEACMHALDIAKKNNVLISLDLSDPGLIGRIRPTFEQVVRNYADIIFVNEDEAKSFTSAAGEEALNCLCEFCKFAVVKLGSEGSLIKCDGMVYRIPVFKTTAVNTNGAGDMYAAGVLYGIARGMAPEKAGILGSYASAKVVAQVGARLSGNIDISPIIGTYN